MSERNLICKTSSRPEKVLGCLFAFAVLTASSHIAIPIGPVPITMQTLAVCLTGVLLGAGYGTFTVAFWVLAGFSGLPLFAFGNSGLTAMLGPTAGYLYAFPIVAFFCGALAQRTGAMRTFTIMFAANLLCLGIGWMWLAAFMDAKAAFMAGVAPFVSGAFLKSVLGMALLFGLDYFRK